MAVHDIPPDITLFVAKYVDSVAYMEALVLLMDAIRTWRPEDLAVRLYINNDEAQAMLRKMRDQQLLLEGHSGFIFSPASTDITDAAKRAVAFYRKALVPMTNLIHSRGPCRIQRFADAFKLKKE